VEFSLEFSGDLSFISAVLGSGAAGASMTLETNGTNRTTVVGLKLALPEGETFAAGTQPIALVTLISRRLTNGPATFVHFADHPVWRRLLNLAGDELDATYQTGTISVQLPTIQAGRVEAASGGLASVPITLRSWGAENGVSFSLAYDPSLLSFASWQPGEGASPDLIFLINTNEVAQGRLGVSLALPAGTSFVAGTQQLVRVLLNVATVQEPRTSSLLFADSPLSRQVASVTAQPIAATFHPGVVTVVTVDLEGDVAGRPDGDRELNLIDWVQTGRFAVGLDSVEPAEFQRADTAPRATRGGGAISLADWVQTGRYTAKLDPVSNVGGPLEPFEEPELAPAAAGPVPSTQVSVASVTGTAGGVIQVPITVGASGMENAIGFTVSFDPQRLIYVQANQITGLVGASLLLNTYGTANGRLGVGLALAPGTALPSGLHGLLQVTFQARPEASGTTTVGFVDIPVARESVSVTAGPIATSYAAADIILNPAGPRLQISRAGESLVIFWPVTGENYELYATEAWGGEWTKVGVTPVRIGDNELVTVSRSSAARYFQLRRP
jgi:hypothetical protein